MQNMEEVYCAKRLLHPSAANLYAHLSRPCPLHDFFEEHKL